MFTIVVTDILFLLRTWALWGRSKIILISLIVLLVVCILAAAGPALYASLNVVKIPSAGSVRSCENTAPKVHGSYVMWVSFMVFDCTIIILTLIKILPARQPNGLTPLIAQLLKDGIQYFVMIFMISITNLIIISVAPNAFLPSITLYSAMTPMLGSRLMLNLRGSILRPPYNEDDTSVELHTLVFNRHPEDESIATPDLI